MHLVWTEVFRGPTKLHGPGWRELRPYKVIELHYSDGVSEFLTIRDEKYRRLDPMTTVKQKKTKPFNKCFIWHRWKIVKDTGAVKYSECKDCGSRIARSTNYGYQPLNHRWLEGLDDFL